jgi:hypothetical protein
MSSNVTKEWLLGENSTSLTDVDDTTAVIGTTGTIGSGVTIPAAGITGTIGSGVTGAGLYASIAIIADQKAYGTNGGTFTYNAWRQRDLNNEISDDDGIVSISSNQFTLEAGTYTISWNAPCHGVDSHASRLYSSTDGAGSGGIEHQVSQTDFALKVGGGTGSSNSVGIGVVTITATRIFRIEHRCQSSQSTNGLGVQANYIYPVGSVPYSRYTMVTILKHR